MSPEVCAVVITYHPDADLTENLELLAAQVTTILIVDNHSSIEEILTIRAVAERLGINLIENTYNGGIGKALNQAVAWTKQQTICEFVLFFDQDSSISEYFVESMVAHYRSYSPSLRVFLVTPLILDIHTGKTNLPRLYGGRILVAQTSGSLMPVHIFDQCGVFREDLFIDYVDYEFCLRLVARNWNILFCPLAEILHQPGNVVCTDEVGSGRVTTYNYSPLRHYYLTRNRLWLLNTYMSSFPRWGFVTLYGMLKEMIHVLRFERDRRRKIAMWWRGFRDACHSRLGKAKF